MNENLSNRLTIKKKIGFSSYQLAQVAETMVNTWQMYYFTTFLGIPVVTVTLMFSLGKIIGSIITPIYGYISDHLYQTKFGRKFGRRKSMLLIGIPAKTLLYITLWIPNLGVSAYFILFLLYYAIMPMLSLSQLTFMSEMTEDSSQRAQLAGINQIGAAVAGIFSSLFTVYLFNLLGANSAKTYFIAALIYDIMSCILLICFYRSVYERPYDESTVLQSTGKKLSPGKRIVSVFWNFLSAIRLKSYLLYLGMYLSEQMFRSLLGTINTYFIIFVLLLDPASVSVSTSVGFIFGIGFLMIYMWLTAKTNGPFTYRIGGFATILVCLAMLWLAIARPSHLTLWFVVLTIALNFGKTGVVNSAQFIFTFIPDVDEMVTGKRREGQYSGVNSALDVLFSTLETLTVGILLSVTGFAEGAQTQNETTVQALLILYTIVPICFAAIGIVISCFFKLTVANHKILLNEINRLRAGGEMSEVSPETKKVVENLTGFKYEHCWGNNNMMDFSGHK
ncbi:MFS transporter [Mediterraneibacter gnavus]|uniref:MFS transporter n=1 Tax=Mediterraneibacter gnavus TaxID=33038 RepID=UPI00232B83B6|nr:MFS transporter [Mediterraneibacter gnavus]MDB8710125.1 MFS transporter [Mediterraneibacter gnavus]MDB8713406.1 MFS transporter [Mediterraneibacter gnavus]